MSSLTGDNIFIFLLQVFLLLGLSRGLGEFFRRFKQPPLPAEILVGVLLGPTIFGRFFPQFQHLIFPHDVLQQTMLETVAWLGIVFLLLEAGLEIDFSSAWRQRGDALVIAVTDILVPIGISFLACLMLPDRYLVHPEYRFLFALFMATVMMLSELPITARILHDLDLSKTDLGFLILSALSVNDIVGWLIVALVLGFSFQAGMSVLQIIAVFSAAIGFTTVCLSAGRQVTNTLIARVRSSKMPEPATSLTLICLLGFACGIITQRIGIQALFGFLLAGIMAGESRELPEKTRQVISHIVYALFAPLFFASIGLRIDFFRQFDPLLVSVVTLVGIAGRFFGAWWGAGFTKQPRDNQLLIALAHTPGGVMQIVVGLLAVQHHLIGEPVFVAIVCSAVISSVVVGPLMNLSLRRRREISILELFARRAIIADLKAKERDHVLYELCETVSEQENMPEADTLYGSVLQRENIMGTALEEGVAVPHARMEALTKPVIVFGRSLSGIEWNSPDGKLSQLIFLILTPLRDDTQVQLLTLIARAMVHKHVREALMKATDEQSVWKILHQEFTAGRIVRKK